MEPSIEKPLGVVSFETKDDKKKYRSKKRKERKLKQEKGEKVKRVYKQEYHSSSEDESEDQSSSGDDEDDDDDSYSSSDEQQQQQQQQRKQPLTKKPKQGEKQIQHKNDPDRFSNIMDSILRKEPEIVKSGGAPILSKYKKKKTEDEIDQEEQKKKLKKKKKEKDLIESLSHKKIDVLITSEERDMMRIAKRGVIKLFNAVAQHQIENPLKNPDEDDEIDPSKDKLTKNQFLSKLKDKKSKESATGNDSKKKQENVKKENSGWDAFDDDLMSNPKSSQWEEYENNE